MALKELLFTAFNKVELNVSINGLPSVRSGDGKQSTPFSIWAKNIPNDLSVL